MVPRALCEFRVRLLRPFRNRPGRARFSGKQLNLLLEALAGTVEEPRDVSPPSSAESALDPELQVLEVHRQCARGPTSTSTVPELRAALPGMRRAVFEGTLRNLDRRGVLHLGRAVDLLDLTPEAHAAAIVDATRGVLLYVSSGTAGEDVS